MTAKTDRLDVNSDSWVNISDGVQSHLALFVRHPSKIRVILSSDGNVPTPQNEEYFSLSSGTDGFTGYRLSTAFDNLEAGDDIWVMNENEGEDHIMVVRGGVEIRQGR
jgi:hypothetical protein